ncbi:hypothetical protein GCM10007415_03580 [Parapedobacter pyrenivorans]|uniref:Uncharacterized protein n=1 Tax=Parapedobacter pyrenivorans TaxID=1305674 RepID=A0A917M2K9_9SPHI|nr:EboA domain-containing protein [Parapedobacter pyrenivorans]GGG75236.1 hypothetical protein GCM10007415_03580 [Parapedobacter pyrenivorans]
MNGVNAGWVADQVAGYIKDNQWEGLKEKLSEIARSPQPGLVAQVFTAIPRNVKPSAQQLRISFGEVEGLGPNPVPVIVRDWSVVQLLRVWFLSQIPDLGQEAYVALIDRLFKYSDMEESVSLYAALPIYRYPKAWQQRCIEGIRSNIGPVRKAIMVFNHYPSRFLEDEKAWNQLVLKAFFTDEDIPNIIGLNQRNNPNLAQALTDYAYERYAAKREINPMLWILVGPYLDERAFDLMERIIIESQIPLEQRAIAYAFKHSNYDIAREYCAKNDRFISLSDDSGTPWEAWEY